MLCEAAGPLGVKVAILDAEDCPARKIMDSKSSLHVAGSFKDPEKIKELARKVDYLTVEIEHVDALVLAEIDMNGVEVADENLHPATKKVRVQVHPAPMSLNTIRDKYEQKVHFGKAKIPVASQLKLEASDLESTLEAAGEAFGYPFIVKSRNNSYDGRGNVVVEAPGSTGMVAKALGREMLYAEQMIKFSKELAVMVIRTEVNEASQTYAYPAVETVHEDSICSTVYMPPRGISEKVCQKAQELACKVVGTLWGRGVFAVEMFVDENG
jgi:phosphoribosylaminoimidazole carboxylase